VASSTYIHDPLSYIPTYATPWSPSGRVRFHGGLRMTNPQVLEEEKREEKEKGTNLFGFSTNFHKAISQG